MKLFGIFCWDFTRIENWLDCCTDECCFRIITCCPMEPNSKKVWLLVAAAAAVALFIFALFVVFLFWWRRKLKDLKARSRRNDFVMSYQPFDDPASSCGISNIGYDNMEDSRSLSPSEAVRESRTPESVSKIPADDASGASSRAVSPDSPAKF